MFYLTWKGSAFKELTRIIAQTHDVERIRKASDWIDYTLRRTPRDMGESRSAGFRLWYGDVLGVYYSIDDTTNRVEILKIGLSKRPK